MVTAIYEFTSLLPTHTYGRTHTRTHNSTYTKHTQDGELLGWKKVLPH